MIAGGVWLLLLGLVTGQAGRLTLAALSAKSLVSLAYLIVFGSLVGFTAYIWLLGVTTAARVSTYAYVNPVVAVLLGWAFAGEAMTLRTALAAGVIVAAVALIIRYGARPGGAAARGSTVPPTSVAAKGAVPRQAVAR
jgi:drug/metabolite transporter (DMT)-like permease